jgi:hypothetical protein
VISANSRKRKECRVKRLALSELIEDWPDAGDSLEELAMLESEALKGLLAGVDSDLAELVWQLRAQARDLLHANEREAPLGTPAAVATAFRDGSLRPKKNWWIVYPLDQRHRRISAPHKSGGSRFVVSLQPKFPTPDALPEVEAASGYLVAWGGPPDVLSIRGVPERIKSFPGSRLVDVIFWDAGSRNLHSLRFGLGESETGPLVFPTNVADTARETKEALWP